MDTRTTRKLPVHLPVGKGIIRVDQDTPSTLAFINGMQAGMLTYEVRGKHTILFDTDIIAVVGMRQRIMSQAPLYHAGFLLGTLATLTQKGDYWMVHQSYCEGYNQGMQAYRQMEPTRVLTIGEICRLLRWDHQGDKSVFQTGYVTGFIWCLVYGSFSVDCQRIAS